MTIIKPLRKNTASLDPRQRAGAAAERQMAHYLHRRFSEDPEVYVLHDLRIVDRKQPEHDGTPGVCQIDNLIVHRWGMFIVESKSVIHEVRVRPDGSGGDEWSRVYRGKEMGMPSPINQAKRQADFLRSLLQRNKKKLIGRMPVGYRTISKIIRGSDQRGFRNAPIQLIISVSDTGRIQRLHGWKEPQRPFPVFVTKSDLVTEKIDRELKQHRKGMNILNMEKTGEHGLWAMEKEEVLKVAKFLADRHVNRSVASVAQPSRPSESNRKSKSSPDKAVRTEDRTEAACKHCSAKNINARWGKFGYYWKCGECGKNTGFPVVCSKCGAKGGRKKTVKIRKKKKQYFRDCKACDTSEVIWAEQ